MAYYPYVCTRCGRHRSSSNPQAAAGRGTECLICLPPTERRERAS